MKAMQLQFKEVLSTVSKIQALFKPRKRHIKIEVL